MRRSPPGFPASFILRLYKPAPDAAFRTLAAGAPRWARANAAAVPYGVAPEQIAALPAVFSASYTYDPDHWVMYLESDVPPNSLTEWWLGGALGAGYHLLRVAHRSPAASPRPSSTRASPSWSAGACPTTAPATRGPRAPTARPRTGCSPPPWTRPSSSSSARAPGCRARPAHDPRPRGHRRPLPLARARGAPPGAHAARQRGRRPRGPPGRLRGAGPESRRGSLRRAPSSAGCTRPPHTTA